jgi:hypothetical protein
MSDYGDLFIHDQERSAYRRTILEQAHFGGIRVAFTPNEQHRLQFDLTGERNVEQQLLICITLHEILSEMCFLSTFLDRSIDQTKTNFVNR